MEVQMPRYRGDNIPPLSDYDHWNEERDAMWYAENKYDMMYADEPMDNDEREFDDDNE
jgi:hypothetical protein